MSSKRDLGLVNPIGLIYLVMSVKNILLFGFSSIRSKTPNRILRRRNKCLSIRERFLMGKSLNLREIFKKLKTEQKL